MKDKSFDFIIIGAGLAGLHAALAAVKHGTVALITKTSLEVSNTYLAQGGIAAVLGKDDSPDFHTADTMNAGREICRHEAVDVLINQGIDNVQSLIKMGMPFNTAGGRFLFGLEGGHSKRRVLHAGKGATGKELVGFLIPLVLKESKVTVFEKTHVDRLIAENDTCKGVHCMALESDTAFVLSGSCILIATGGASAIYSRTTNNTISVGEGISLAYEIGAEIESMEFLQFHPTAFFSETGKPFLISEAVRGEGAHLINHNGERFLDKAGLNELSPRDVVSEAIFNELKDSGRKHVFLALSHLDSKKIKNRFKTIYINCLEENIDFTKENIPVAPAAHYTIGGIKTGLNGETNIKRLYAAGEVASTGVHGANRMASNSLLECLVFAKRAVEHAALNILRDNGAASIPSSPALFPEISKQKQHSAQAHEGPENVAETPENIHSQARYDKIKAAVGEIMWDNAGIIRDKASLERALSELEKIEQNLKSGSGEYSRKRIISLVEVAKMIVLSALERKESRGCHFRSDFPEKNPNFLGTIILQKNKPPHFHKL